MVRVSFFCVYTDDTSAYGKTIAVNKYLEDVEAQGNKVLSFQYLKERRSSVSTDMYFIDFVLTYETGE